MECFPQCEPCTGLCKAPVQGSPVSTRTRIEYTDRLVGQQLECGHRVSCPPSVLGALTTAMGRLSVWCDNCGKWQKLRKNESVKKKNEPSPGQEELIPF